jgi:ribosome-binding factor A
MEFVKYHKRVTRNVHRELNQIIQSSKQTMVLGVKSDFMLQINYVRLNKATSVVTAWWSIAVVQPDAVPLPVRQHQMTIEQEFIQSEIQTREQEIAKLQEQQDQAPTTEQLKPLTPLDVLVQRDQHRKEMIEAEIQKKLTKASGYLSGQLAKALGLRYAPELRFFKDNTLEVLKGFRDQKEKIEEE